MWVGKALAVRVTSMRAVHIRMKKCPFTRMVVPPRETTKREKENKRREKPLSRFGTMAPLQERSDDKKEQKPGNNKTFVFDLKE